MANEILKDEILKDEELDNVAGGTLGQTWNDMDRFTRETGFGFHGSDSSRREQFRDIRLQRQRVLPARPPRKQNPQPQRNRSHEHRDSQLPPRRLHLLKNFPTKKSRNKSSEAFFN